MIVIFIAFFVSLFLALATVPTLSSVAHRFGLVDKPDNNRKLHRTAIPMVGGLALFFAATVATSLAIFVGASYDWQMSEFSKTIYNWIPHRFRPDSSVNTTDYYEMIGLFLGALLLLGVGLADDRFGIRGRQKLLGQFLAVSVLILFGFQFNNVMILGVEIEFGIFSIFVIYAWVIAAINSVNLLDGADGIASTIGIVMSLAVCIMSLSLGQTMDAIVAAAIAGGLLGFLRFNFPPAKAYLGDSGSMLIGFLLSALAIRGMFKQNSAYAFFAPVALLAIPFIDTAAAIIRRRLTGRSIFAVDRGHLHHALMKRGYSPRISLLWVALLCSTTAAGGVLSLFNRTSEYALASILIVLFVMIGCKIFGVAEYQLVSRKANTLARSFFRLASSDSADVLQSSVHVQGNRDWQDVWKNLCDFADEHQLNQLTMDLNAPWLHESFHATRRRSDVQRGENKEWFTLIPLVVQSRVFGRIEVLGSHDTAFTHHEIIGNLLRVTADIEQSLADLDLAAHPSSHLMEHGLEENQPDDTLVESAGTSL